MINCKHKCFHHIVLIAFQQTIEHSVMKRFKKSVGKLFYQTENLGGGICFAIKISGRLQSKTAEKLVEDLFTEKS